MKKKFLEKFKIKELGVLDYKYWIVSVRPKQLTIGSMVISLKRDCSELRRLTSDETKELSKVFKDTEELLFKVFAFDKINYSCLMMVDNQIHFHVIPRYEHPVVFEGEVFEDNSWPGPPNFGSIIKGADVASKVHNHLLEFNLTEPSIVGYTTGVYDLFHIGHLNILKEAKRNCDYLIVGVTSDELVEQRKKKKPIICLEERISIIESLKCVDKVVIQDTMDKFVAWNKHKFDRMFVGDDWKGTEKWNKLESDFGKLGVEIVYFPYTTSTSSTIIRKILEEKIIKI